MKAITTRTVRFLAGYLAYGALGTAYYAFMTIEGATGEQVQAHGVSTGWFWYGLIVLIFAVGMLGAATIQAFRRRPLLARPWLRYCFLTLLLALLTSPVGIMVVFTVSLFIASIAVALTDGRPEQSFAFVLYLLLPVGYIPVMIHIFRIYRTMGDRQPALPAAPADSREAE